MTKPERFFTGKVIALVLLALAVGLGIGEFKRDREQQEATKAKQTYAERKAAKKAKEAADLQKPPGERIYQTSRGELLVLGVNIKPKGEPVQTVACFVWLGQSGQTAMDCPQSPIDIDELVNQRLDEQADIADGRAQGLDHRY